MSAEPALALRAARPDDAAAIAAVIVRSRAAFVPYAPSPHDAESTQRWVEGVLVPNGGVTVAVVEGVVVGVLATSTRDGARWIDQLYLAPEHVGRGLGAQLLARTLAALARPIRLWVFEANTGARRFYERHGFVAVARTDGAHNEERVPDVLYELA